MSNNQATYSYKRRRYGRKPRDNLKQAWKHINIARSQEILRFQCMNRFDSTSAGRVPVLQIKNSGSGSIRYPLHLYSLTGHANNVQDGSTVTNDVRPYVGWVLACSNDTGTGNYFWESRIAGDVPSTGAAGALLSKEASWHFEHTDQPTGNIPAPHADSLLDWVQIKLMLYGTLNLPVKYVIDICQINEDFMQPNIDGVISATGLPYSMGNWGANTEQTRERDAFLGSLVQPYAFSPLVVNNFKQGRYFKILKRNIVMIQPTDSTELPAGSTGTTTNPHQRQLDLFMRMNRKCRYDWVGRAPIDINGTETGGGVQDGTAYDLDTGERNQIDVDPKARIFLMIRATCCQLELNAADYKTTPNTRFQPSYDVVIRKSHTKLAF